MGYAILDQRGGDSLTATTLDGYSLLADTTVGTATTTVTFNGLNVGWGDELLLVSDIVNGSGSNTYVSLFVNGLNTRTNYYQQYLSVNSTNISSGRNNDNELSMLPVSSKVFSICNIKMTNSGYFTMKSNEFSYGNSSAYTNYDVNTSTFMISSITSLTISAQTANAIGSGSRFQLYKSGGGASRTWAIT